MGRRLSILAFEGDANDAVAIRMFLEEAGFELDFRWVDTLPALAEALEREPPDLVLSEDRVGEWLGREALHRVQRQCPEVPFLLVSSGVSEIAAVDYLKRGTVDVVFKRHLARLGPSIRRALALAEERQRRRDAERAWRESEARYRKVVYGLFEGLVVVRADGQVQLANGAAARILGAPVDQVQSRSLSEDWGFVDSAGRPLPPARHPAERALKSALPVSELIGLRREGEDEPRWLACRTHPLVHEGERKPYAVVTTFEDVTDRQKAEERQAQIDAQLERSQRLQTVGTLTSGIAHDFNNVLAPILGSLQLAIDRLDGEHQARGDLKRAVEGARRGRELVRQLLGFTAGTSHGRGELALEGVVREAVGFLGGPIRRGVDIAVEVEPDLPNANAHETQMVQVVLNLCVNALHALSGVQDPKLSVHVRSLGKEDDQRLLDLGMPVGEYLCIEVKDNGCGMDEATRARLFEPFFTTKASGEGTGLGLAMVRGILQEHSGAIHLDSAPGLGTAFQLYVPQWQQSAEAASLPRDVLERQELRSVLLVDDDPSGLETAAGLLRSLGCQVEILTHPQQAVRRFVDEPEKFDLIVSDEHMPRMRGRDLIEEVRTARPGVPAVLLTAYPTPQLIGWCQARQVACLPKPATVGDFERTVRRALQLTAPSAAGDTEHGSEDESRSTA